MKKTKLFTIASLMFMGSIVNAQSVEQGTMLVDAYYGFPNLYTTVLKAAYTGGSSSNVSVRGIGPVGVKFEYMVSDKVGIGVDGHYSNTSLTYTDFNSTGSAIYDYTVSRSVYRVMPRFNYHFGRSDSFDGYTGVGVGYRRSVFSLKTDDPDYIDDNVKGIIPVSFRFFVGGRYFFTENIGINMEFGASGGAMIQGGLSVKF